MLESSSLLLLPWTPDRAGAGLWLRPVLEGGRGASLGQVRYREPPRRSWFAWLHACRLEVLETEDAALLCTLVRSRGMVRLWDLYDAEERRVGSICPPCLLDSDGQRRGTTRLADGRRGDVLGPSGECLADFAVGADQALQLRFAPDPDPNPFLRMLLLADVLTLQPPPSMGGER